LSADAIFGVTETYAAKMDRTTGAFFLGMENTEQYRRESSICRQAIPADVVERIRKIAGESAAALVAKARPTGRLDVVGALSRVVPLRIVERFFGVPGPDDQTMQGWMRLIFWEIFLNLADDPEVARRAASASHDFGVYLTRLIAERKQGLGDASPDDFLTRLLRLQADPATRLDDDAVRRNVGGILGGAVDTTSKAIAYALDQLLERPAALAGARQAAERGDDQALAAHVFEALRFNPHNTILLRTCHEDYVLAQGTAEETLIPKGTTVVAATLSAMFDESVLRAPGDFLTDRPAEHYLHFGRGLHTCFGERLNRVVIPEVIKHVLLLPDLRRASGAEGQIVYEGPFPDRFVVEFTT
jgi:cytochrome P450